MKFIGRDQSAETATVKALGLFSQQLETYRPVILKLFDSQNLKTLILISKTCSLEIFN